MAIVLKNAMETLVQLKLDNMIARLGCCSCEQCRMDIAAYALNNLPPKYVATLQGELFCKLDALQSQHDADVTTMIVKAIEMVKANPRHKV